MKRPEPTWMVVADASRARIFATDTGLRRLREIADLTHPESRMLASDLLSDQPGKMKRAAGSVDSSAMELPTHYKQAEARRFAREIADRLLEGWREGSYAALYLVASPTFLGLLREQLDPQVAGAVRATVNRDYTKLTFTQLRQRLPAQLGLVSA